MQGQHSLQLQKWDIQTETCQENAVYNSVSKAGIILHFLLHSPNAQGVLKKGEEAEKPTCLIPEGWGHHIQIIKKCVANAYRGKAPLNCVFDIKGKNKMK